MDPMGYGWAPCCSQGAVFAWPLLLEHRQQLPAAKLAEAVWAASAVPSPPKEPWENVFLVSCKDFGGYVLFIYKTYLESIITI